MVQKVLIFGITDLAELLFSYIESDPNYNVLGFVVDHQFQEKKNFVGKKSTHLKISMIIFSNSR